MRLLHRAVPVLIALAALMGIVTVQDSAEAQSAPKGYDAYSLSSMNKLLPVEELVIMPITGGRLFCVTAQDLYSSSGRLHIEQDVLGTDLSATHWMRPGRTKQMCVDMPDKGCPKVNLKGHNDGVDINFGTFPTCGMTLRLPTTDNPVMQFCKKNTSDHARTLLLKNRNGVVRDSERVAPGEVACVTKGFQARWAQRVEVLWKDNPSGHYGNNILLAATIWRN